jgi:hypothetical protein
LRSKSSLCQRQQISNVNNIFFYPSNTLWWILCVYATGLAVQRNVKFVSWHVTRTIYNYYLQLEVRVCISFILWEHWYINILVNLKIAQKKLLIILNSICKCASSEVFDMNMFIALSLHYPLPFFIGKCYKTCYLEAPISRAVARLKKHNTVSFWNVHRRDFLFIAPTIPSSRVSRAARLSGADKGDILPSRVMARTPLRYLYLRHFV